MHIIELRLFLGQGNTPILTTSVAHLTEQQSVPFVMPKLVMTLCFEPITYPDIKWIRYMLRHSRGLILKHHCGNLNSQKMPFLKKPYLTKCLS